MQRYILTRQARRRQWIRNFKANAALWIFVLPGIILLLLFHYFPIFGIQLAFKNYNFTKGIFGSPWCGMKNFRFIFRSSTTWRMLRNTVGYFFLFQIVGTAAKVTLAIALNECRGKYFARTSQTVMIVPTFISFIAVSFITKGLLANNGLINGVIRSLGGETISFYTSPQYWPYILLFVDIWKNVGYGSVLYLSAIAGMDQEIFEAADIDGASRMQKIRYLTLPMLSYMVAILLLMSLGGIMSSSTGLFYQVTRNSSALYPTTQTLDSYVLNAMYAGGSTFGQTAALTLFQSTVGCIMVVTVNLIVRRISPEHSLF